MAFIEIINSEKEQAMQEYKRFENGLLQQMVEDEIEQRLKSSGDPIRSIAAFIATKFMVKPSGGAESYKFLCTDCHCRFDVTFTYGNISYIECPVCSSKAVKIGKISE